jgi:hypothetical protein
MRQSNPRWFGAILLIVIGTIALLETTGLVEHRVIKDILRHLVKWWPLLLIAMGIRMLMNGSGKGRD